MNSLKTTKVAIFDFCGTFVNFQTGDEFVRFLARKYFCDDARINLANKKIKKFNRLGLTYIHDCLSTTPLNKIVLARAISGIPFADSFNIAEEYAKNMLFTNVVEQTLKLYNECKKNGYYVVLVSAAYGIYLEHFSKKYGFDAILSSDLMVKHGRLTGKIVNDTVGMRKVKRVLNWLDKTIGKGKYEVVLSVGDSKKDIPVLSLAKRRIVISKNSHQSWANKSFEEIIYVN